MRTAQAVGRLDAAQKLIVLAALVLVPAVFWRDPISAFQLPKASLLVVAATALVVLSILRAWISGRIEVPTSPPAVALGGLLVVFAVVTAFSREPGLSLFGQYNRWSGLLVYAACAVLFLVALARRDATWPRAMSGALLLGCAIVVAYGLLQWAGLDVITWGGTEDSSSNVFSTQGNSNFAAAVAAIPIPIAVHFAASRRSGTVVRWLAGAYVPAAILVVYATRGVQGALVAGVGLVTMAAAIGVVVFWHDPVHRRRLLVTVGVAAVVAVVAVVVAWPLLSGHPSVEARLYMWQAAVNITADHPIVGTGPDTYLHYFFEYRPAGHAAAFPRVPADAPHSVPLGMFYGGGLLLGLAWLAFIGLVGWSGLRGLTRVEPPKGARSAYESALLPGAALGAWAGYQVQSLVSIDVPTLVLAHFATAAIVLLCLAPDRRRTATVAKRGRTRRTGPIDTGVWIGAIGLGGLVVWASLLPLRADLAAAHAARTAAQGDPETSLQAFERATGLAPWQSTYWFQSSVAHLNRGESEQALDDLERAAEAAHGTSDYAHRAATLAAELGQVERARVLWEEAIRANPADQGVAEQAETYLREHG